MLLYGGLLLLLKWRLDCCGTLLISRGGKCRKRRGRNLLLRGLHIGRGRVAIHLAWQGWRGLLWGCAAAVNVRL